MIYSFKCSKSWTSDMLMKGLVLLIGNPKRETTRLILSDERLPTAIYVSMAKSITAWSHLMKKV